MGRTDEAIEVATRAVEIDPISPIAHNELGLALLVDGQTDAALKQYQRALQLDPEFFQTHWALADVYIYTRQFDKAMPHLEKQREIIEPQAPIIHAVLGHQYALVGRPDETKKILSQLMEKAKSEYVPATAFAYLYLGLQNYDEALNWFEAAYDERNLSMVWLRKWWMFDVLRDDVRFQDLVARMHFPE